jgi:hypothetical protein
MPFTSSSGFGAKQCSFPTADDNVDKGQNSGNPVHFIPILLQNLPVTPIGIRKHRRKFYRFHFHPFGSVVICKGARLLCVAGCILHGWMGSRECCASIAYF